MEKYKGNKLSAVHSFTVFPQDLNYAGSLFGGKVLAECDLAGVKVVRRALYETKADNCVTASFDRVDFKKPAVLGDLITMNVDIKSFGKSTIQVRIKVSRESIEGEIEEICVANLTFVSMKDGKPFNHGLCFGNIEEEKC